MTNLETMTITYYPELALFTQQIDESAEDASSTFTVTFNPPHTDGEALPAAPTRLRKNTIAIPLEPDVEYWTSRKSPMHEVGVDLHASPTKAVVMPADVSEWFSERLKMAVVLVYLGQNRRKVLGNLAPGGTEKADSAASGSSSWLPSLSVGVPSFLNGAFAPKTEGSEEQITFTDIAPYLVVTKESLANVSSRLPDGMDMDVTKFRPNIVLSGAREAYDEDFWGAIKLETAKSHAVKSQFESDRSAAASTAEIILTQNCARCKSLNVDFQTGQTAKGEAGKILGKLMKDRRVDKGWKYSPVFGRYGFLHAANNDENGARQQGNWVRVGSKVEVSKRNTERTTFGTFSILITFFTIWLCLTGFPLPPSLGSLLL